MKLFVTVFEQFCTANAFLNATETRAVRPFASKALQHMIKTLFEGQASRLSALLVLKSLYPDTLCDEPFSNYRSVTKDLVG